MFMFRRNMINEIVIFVVGGLIGYGLRQIFHYDIKFAKITEGLDK